MPKLRKPVHRRVDTAFKGCPSHIAAYVECTDWSYGAGGRLLGEDLASRLIALLTNKCFFIERLHSSHAPILGMDDSTVAFDLEVAWKASTQLDDLLTRVPDEPVHHYEYLIGAQFADFVRQLDAQLEVYTAENRDDDGPMASWLLGTCALLTHLEDAIMPGVSKLHIFASEQAMPSHLL